MDQTNDQRKDSIMKTLAVIGFIGALFFIVWLAVKVVALVPSAFSSLASIADSIYNQSEQTLEITTETSVINSGEGFAINWEPLRGKGVYSFAYECVEGVSVDIRYDGAVTPVACDEYVSLDAAEGIELFIETTNERFTDVAYEIMHTDSQGTIVADSGIVTVVNMVATDTSVATDTTKTTTSTAGIDDITDIYTGAPDPAPATPAPVTVKEYVYATPTSDPNGIVDLSIAGQGIGTIKNGAFVAQSIINSDETGAIQFVVKNQGTKTAASWSYTATLPNGTTYRSGEQSALKPNERAVITLGFAFTDDAPHQVRVVVTAAEDTMTNNNVYAQTLTVVE